MALMDVALGALVVLVATCLGSFVVVVIRRIDRFLYSVMLAFSGGVMTFSVMEMSMQSHASSGEVAAIAGLASGAVLLLAFDRLLPHIHARIRKSELMVPKKKAALLAGALTLHNVPEGFAVGSAFASSVPLGWVLTASIALQDIPEGLLVSAPLACYGVNTRKAVGFGIFSGIVEAAAAVSGYMLLSIVKTAVPLALSVSAGAMLYVVLVEIMPDAFTRGVERKAALFFLAGFAIAFALSGITF